MNYVDIYKTILIAIKENNCSDFAELLKIVSNEKSVIELRKKIGDENSSIDTDMTIANMNVII